jgi:hypothetical protein
MTPGDLLYNLAFGQRTEAQKAATVEAAAKDIQRASGGRMSYQQSQNSVSADIAAVDRMNDADARKRMLLIGGSLAVGLLLLMRR